MTVSGKNTIQSILFRGIYFILVSAAVVFIFKNPVRFWDMLAYMGCVVSIDKNDPKEIHRITYTEFNKYATPAMKSSMIEGHSFCKNLSVDPQKFFEQLPFFRIKMLYVYLSWIFYKLGIPLFYAVLLPAILGFMGISMVLYNWISQHFQTWICLVFSFLFLLFNLNFDAFRIASPDALAGFFLLTGTFLYLEKKNMFLTTVFFMLTLLTRIDNVIFIDLLFLLVIFDGMRTDRKRILVGVTAIILSILLLWLVRYQSGGYDTYRMFYRSFVQLLENPYTTDLKFNSGDYFTGIKNGIRASLHNTVVFILPVLILLWLLIRKFKLTTTENIFVIAMIFSFVARIFIHPLFETRYLFVFIIVFMVLILRDGKKYLRSRKQQMQYE